MNTHSEINYHRDEEINNLRDSLSSVMKSHELTQQDIYDQTGVTQSTISLFLNGHRGLSGNSALKIMRFIIGQQKAN